MKKITIQFLAMLIIVSAYEAISTSSFAQAPEKMSYQAVIRNSSNQLVTDHAIRMKISILQGSVSGTAVYAETQATSTNANGLVTIEIGGGTIITGSFSEIDWAAGPYFIKTETDPTGGTSYTITGTSQLLSVPYAMYSTSSANGFTSVYSETDPRPVLANNGNIGIGSYNNWAKLHVNGITVIEPGQATWGSQIVLDASSLEKGKMYRLTSTGGDAGEGMGRLVIGYSGAESVMVMDANLNVGIGTNNPVSKLDVNGKINVNNNQITNVADPENNNDAANKAYVDYRAPVHYVGESYGGGIVFYVYDNGQHGLIAATADQSTGIRWHAGTYLTTTTSAEGVGAGKTNTAIILAAQGYGDGYPYAAYKCSGYSVTVDGVTYGDWYLPSRFELNLLYLQKNVVGGFANENYWCSLDGGYDMAWYQNFSNGNQAFIFKTGTFHVRAIRAF
jgi:hypothetical protein